MIGLILFGLSGIFIGGLSGLFTRNSVSVYQTINKPLLSPPSLIFPIVWTILYIMIGISAAIIYQNEKDIFSKPFIIYYIQLFLNFFWSFIFFTMQNYLLALIWIIMLLLSIIIMIFEFYQINKFAAILLIPYLIWVLFASYLNLSIYLLN